MKIQVAGGNYLKILIMKFICLKVLGGLIPTSTEAICTFLNGRSLESMMEGPSWIVEVLKEEKVPCSHPCMLQYLGVWGLKFKSSENVGVEINHDCSIKVSDHDCSIRVKYLLDFIPFYSILFYYSVQHWFPPITYPPTHMHTDTNNTYILYFDQGLILL